jgi:hypothetical protein
MKIKNTRAIIARCELFRACIYFQCFHLGIVLDHSIMIQGSNVATVIHNFQFVQLSLVPRVQNFGQNIVSCHFIMLFL